MPRRTKRRAPSEGSGTAVATAPRKRPPGRPPVVADKHRVDELLKAVAVGVPLSAALDHARIPNGAHYRAMEAGEAAQAKLDDGGRLTDREAEYREYRDLVLRARARVAVEHAQLVRTAARGGALIEETTYRNDDGKLVTERKYAPPQWQAAKFMLQARFREDFQTVPAKTSVELTGADGGPIEVQHSEADVLSLAERLHVVAERQRQQLPGGWDPEPDAEGGVEPVDYAVIVDETYEERGSA